MKSARPIFLISILIALVSFGVVAYLMFAGPDRLQLSGKSAAELWESGDLLGVLVLPIVFIITGFAILPLAKLIFPAEIKDGIMARARVVKVWDTGVSINDNPQVGLLLEVKPLAGAPFEVESKTVVSRLNAALVQPGSTAEVIYDPRRPKRLRVLSVQADGIASAGAQGAASTRMEQLNELLEKNLISEAEFQQKRTEILKDL